MIAIIKHVVAGIVDSYRFAAAVWHDARSMQAEAAKRYGHFDYT